MKIHILPSVGQSVLRFVIEESITTTNHQLGEASESNFAIGLLGDTEWENFKPEQMIILKSPCSVDTVLADATLVNLHTLTLMEDPQTTLRDWLRTL